MKPVSFTNDACYEVFGNIHVYNLLVKDYKSFEEEQIEKYTNKIREKEKYKTIEGRVRLNKEIRIQRDNELMDAKLKAIEYAKRKFLYTDITYKQFYNIQDDFNKLIRTEILNGYKFLFPYLVTLIGVIRKKRTGTQVNWGESNKNKQKLIEQGLEPALQIKDETNPNFGKTTARGTPILTNDNLWQVYFIEENRVVLCYMPIKIRNPEHPGRLKFWQLMFWKGGFVKSMKLELNRKVNSKEIDVDLISNTISLNHINVRN